jgi:hypothetical protein
VLRGLGRCWRCEVQPIIVLISDYVVIDMDWQHIHYYRYFWRNPFEGGFFREVPPNLSRHQVTE